MLRIFNLKVFSSMGLVRCIALSIILLSLTGCSFFSIYDKEQYILYPVKSGDTIFEISKEFGLTVPDIVNANPGVDPKKLRIGAKLSIPFNLITSKIAETRRGRYQQTGGGKIKQRASSQTKNVKLGKSSAYIGRLVWPLSDGTVTSKFGRRWFSFHEGIDIAAKKGRPIRAAHSGTVVYSGNSLSGYGNMVIIQAKDLLTVYAHNQKNMVKKGRSVKRGQTIALVGATGKATGPHVHFETRIFDSKEGNIAVNPYTFFPTR